MAGMTDLAADAKVVVKFCNKIRKKAGLGRIQKPRRGIPKHNQACSLAMSLEGTPFQTVDYDGDKLLVECTEGWVEITGGDISTVTRFMENFDNYLYPQYEIPFTPIKVKGEVLGPQEGPSKPLRGTN